MAAGTWRHELEVRRKDGTRVPVEASATAVVLATGTVYVSALRDISARWAAEQVQRDFLAVVTHELRSPLAAIRGYAQLLQRRGVAPAKTPAVETILTQATRLDRLIGDLLDVAQVQAGQLELRWGTVDLGALAREGAAQAQTLTTRHAVRVVVPPTPLVGWWDGDRLAQVLQNLLGNALKYAPEGGEIGVRVWAAEGAAHLTVRDQTSYQLAASTLQALVQTAAALPAPARTALQARIAAYTATAARYQNDPRGGAGMAQLLAQAHRWEEERDRAERQVPSFNDAQALFQIAIVLGSVSIVATSRPVLIAGLVLGALGLVLMLNGYVVHAALPLG